MKPFSKYIKDHRVLRDLRWETITAILSALLCKTKSVRVRCKKGQEIWFATA